MDGMGKFGLAEDTPHTLEALLERKPNLEAKNRKSWIAQGWRVCFTDFAWRGRLFSGDVYVKVDTRQVISHTCNSDYIYTLIVCLIGCLATNRGPKRVAKNSTMMLKTFRHPQS